MLAYYSCLFYFVHIYAHVVWVCGLCVQPATTGALILRPRRGMPDNCRRPLCANDRAAQPLTSSRRPWVGQLFVNQTLTLLLHACGLHSPAHRKTKKLDCNCQCILCACADDLTTYLSYIVLKQIILLKLSIL